MHPMTSCTDGSCSHAAECRCDVGLKVRNARQLDRSNVLQQSYTEPALGLENEDDVLDEATTNPLHTRPGTQ